MRPEFINQIKSFEGFKTNVYKCPGGYYTIGYGHVIKRPEVFATGIHTGEAHVLLCQDLEKARQAVLRMVRVPLTLHQEESLTSFVFNLGTMAFHRSTLRAKINRGNHQAVPQEICRWVFSAGQKLAGLVKRREWEAAWYQRVERMMLEEDHSRTILRCGKLNEESRSADVHLVHEHRRYPKFDDPQVERGGYYVQ